MADVGQVIGGVVSVGTNLFGASKTAKAADKAADLQAEAAREAIAEQRRQFDYTSEKLEPWADAGENALDWYKYTVIPGADMPNPRLDQLQAELDALNAGAAGGATPTTGQQPVQPADSTQPTGQPGQLMAYGQLSDLPYTLPAAQPGGGTTPTGQETVKPGTPVTTPRLTPEQEKRRQFLIAKIDRKRKGQNKESQGASLTKFLRSTPGYMFALREGQRSLDRTAAAKGSRFSGRQLKAATRYGSDYGDLRFGDWQDQLYRLQGGGQNAAARQGAFAMEAGGNIGNALLDTGRARAGAEMDKAGSWTNAADNIGNDILFNYYYRRQPSSGTTAT